MDSVGGTPANHSFEGDLSQATSEVKKRYLDKCLSEIVTKFATHRGLTLDGDNNDEETTSLSDRVYEYAASVVGLGLMARNCSDATREGDGERLMRSWKFLMLHFKADG